MTVAALIMELQSCPALAEVIMAQDSEGNGFSPLSSTTEEHYITKSTSSGCLADDDDVDEEGQPHNSPCVVLWPVN